MNKMVFFLFSALFLISGNSVRTQVLNVPEVFQEQNQWCWAGVSSCVLDYYCTPTEQCTIAEYTRTVANWHDFGNVDCCIDPSQGCNYWNYNWGYPGSIQDILIHFASIQNNGIGSYLSESTIHTDLGNNSPFIIRWGWTSGGGHFLVGHGLIDDDLYYMNPWFGEGLKIGTYSWVISGSNHTWTHTNQLVTPSPRPYPAGPVTGPELLTKGQQNVAYSTLPVTNATSYSWEVNPSDAGEISSTTNNALLNLVPDFLGNLTITVAGNNSCGEGNSSDPVQVTVIPEVGIPDPGTTSHLKLFPNPSSGKVFFNTGTSVGDLTYEIISVCGNILLEKDLHNCREIDLTDLPKGIYFIKIKSNSSVFFSKLVLQ